MMLVPLGKLRKSNARGLEPLLSLAQVRHPRRAPISETLERRLLPLRREPQEKPSVRQTSTISPVGKARTRNTKRRNQESLKNCTHLYADDDLARRVAQVELDAKAAEVAAPALATMDGSLHALPSKPAPGLDDMDGSLYNLRAFG